MIQKKTDDLLRELKTAESIDGYLQENDEQLLNESLPVLLERLLTEKQLSKSEVLRRAEINDIYGYQLFAGSRKPSRDKLIALCVGMGLNVDEIQTLLKTTGFAPLYAKNKRDSILLFGIERGASVCEINGTLYDRGENTL